MKKLFAMLVTAAMIASLLAGCSDSKAPGSSTTPSAPSDSQSVEATGSNWPSSTVQIYVPASAGGGTDTITRVLTDSFSKVTGQNFVVVNDPTGNGTVVAETIRNAKTDGLNLEVYHSAFCGLIASGQYDHTLEDFTFLGLLTTPGIESDALFVSSDSPFQTLDDLVAYAKEHPGELISGAQSGQTDHFEQALLNQELGIDVTVVDCGGNAEKIPALMGGSIDMAIIASVNSADYVKSGDLRCLATLGESKSEIFADVPTLAECGYSAVGLPTVCFLLGPSGMSDADVAKINEYMKAVSEDPEVAEKLKKMGTQFNYMSQEDSWELMKGIQDLYTAAAPSVFGK